MCGERFGRLSPPYENSSRRVATSGQRRCQRLTLDPRRPTMFDFVRKWWDGAERARMCGERFGRLSPPYRKQFVVPPSGGNLPFDVGPPEVGTTNKKGPRRKGASRAC